MTLREQLISTILDDLKLKEGVSIEVEHGEAIADSVFTVLKVPGHIQDADVERIKSYSISVEPILH